jgi:hypothetical protein
VPGYGWLVDVKTSFDHCDVFLAFRFALFDFFDEVVGFGDCAVGVDLDNVHVHVFALLQGLTCDHVPNVYDALATFIRVVVEENVLGDVVSLIHH